MYPFTSNDYVSEEILSYLDWSSLCAAELVCLEWQRVIAEGRLWKKLVERKVRTDSMWRGLAKRKEWMQYLFNPKPGCQHPDHSFYKRLYRVTMEDIKDLEKNWRYGKYNIQCINNNCTSDNFKGVYCLQYDDSKIVSGLRDNTIKIWDRKTLQCIKQLKGHTGSVLCLQYDETAIVSGSSDGTIRVWDVHTGELLNTLNHRRGAVMYLRFRKGMMVTGGAAGVAVVWKMISLSNITVRHELVGHIGAVNSVDFDENYIVSASGDTTIKVWGTSSFQLERTLRGHTRGISCLQYQDPLVVSGSSDRTIRLWNIETGLCIRILEGHDDIVRCLRFDNKRIVSGAIDGMIKVWDLSAALEQSTPDNHNFCLRTLIEHTSRVLRLQFDEFQIVSSSHDDTIVVWDFFSCGGGSLDQPEQDGDISDIRQRLRLE